MRVYCFEALLDVSQNGKYKEFGLARPTVPSNPLKVVSLTQQKAVPLLERLVQLLEESKQPSLSPSTYCQRISEEEWDKLLELSPLFQLLKGVERKLRGPAGSYFIDYLNAQWECEGELLLLDPNTLNPIKFLVYQHGLFLLQTLHTLKLCLCVTRDCSQPEDSFCSSSLSHVAVGDMSVDSSLAFQRVFFKVLQACLGELFQARLGRSSMGREGAAPQSSMPWDSHSTSSNPTSLLERLQRPSWGLLSQEEVEGHLQKHREWSVFLHVERLLREMSSGLRTMDVRHND
ncbi:unnamed protein product, partial [Coregonus sp. 'balchen']